MTDVDVIVELEGGSITKFGTDPGRVLPDQHFLPGGALRRGRQGTCRQPSWGAVFALVYDDRNPYFSKTGDWPGWPEILKRATNREGVGQVRCASVSSGRI